MQSEDTIEIGFNAGRVCEAIARIGYEPHTAIMDIVDNSVTAKATEVKISLELAPGKNLKSRNSVCRYQIVDNGVGLDENGIKNAFKLGSDANYPSKSLSKYGMGLKSAGLSLGTKIHIISKREGSFGARYTFDKHKISNTGVFVIGKQSLSAEEISRYQAILTGAQGTIVEIEGCEEINHASPNSTVDKLRKRLGVVYFSFLSRANEPLQLSTRVIANGKTEPFEQVVAKDMLFMDHAEFKRNWDPDSYDYSSPYLVLEEDWKLPAKDGKALSPIKVHAVAFPQNIMGDKASPLTPEQKSQVRSFDVSRENKGFYVYRNGRLIRWGDDLEGIVGKDDINIRLRIDLESEHDDVLHVDVTKQRLEIDDEIRNDLQKIVSKAKETASAIRDACQQLKNEPTGDEGKSFSDTTTNVPEDDPQELGTGAAPEETQRRRSARAAEAEIAIEELNEERQSAPPADGKEPSAVEVSDEFRKVRYSEKIPYGQVWKPFYDAKNGVFVCINKHHPFYQEFLSRFPDNSTERVVLEALIFSVGVAESNVVDNVRDLSREALEGIFKRFHKNIDNWLGGWTEENINLNDK
ncbi:ATP-binding protein [Cupriavidus basilensis]